MTLTKTTLSVPSNRCSSGGFRLVRLLRLDQAQHANRLVVGVVKLLLGGLGQVHLRQPGRPEPEDATQLLGPIIRQPVEVQVDDEPHGRAFLLRPVAGRGSSGHERTSLSLTTTLLNCIFEPSMKTLMDILAKYVKK